MASRQSPHPSGPKWWRELQRQLDAPLWGKGKITPIRRKRRRRASTQGLQVVALMGLCFLAGGMAYAGLNESLRAPVPPPAAARPQANPVSDIAPQPRNVLNQRPRTIDGDTFELADGERIRLTTIDTPEMGNRANCPQERALADAATRAARQALAQGQQIEIVRTGRVDRYGRTLADIRVDGRDLGETLIAQGVAQPWRGQRAQWCSN